MGSSISLFLKIHHSREVLVAYSLAFFSQPKILATGYFCYWGRFNPGYVIVGSFPITMPVFNLILTHCYPPEIVKWFSLDICFFFLWKELACERECSRGEDYRLIKLTITDYSVWVVYPSSLDCDFLFPDLFTPQIFGAIDFSFLSLFLFFLFLFLLIWRA